MTYSSASLQPLIEELRAALEGMTIKCPGIEIEPGIWLGCDSRGGTLHDCPYCFGRDYVPDPQYAPLLALVREKIGEHSSEYAERGWEWSRCDEPICRKHHVDNAEGFYFTRTDWGRDEGALTGAIEYLLKTHPSLHIRDLYWRNRRWGFLEGDDTNAGSVRALLAALKEMKK